MIVECNMVKNRHLKRISWPFWFQVTAWLQLENSRIAALEEILLLVSLVWIKEFVYTSNYPRKAIAWFFLASDLFTWLLGDLESGLKNHVLKGTLFPPISFSFSELLRRQTDKWKFNFGVWTIKVRLVKTNKMNPQHQWTLSFLSASRIL